MRAYREKMSKEQAGLSRLGLAWHQLDGKRTSASQMPLSCFSLPPSLHTLVCSLIVVIRFQQFIIQHLQLQISDVQKDLLSDFFAPAVCISLSFVSNFYSGFLILFHFISQMILFSFRPSSFDLFGAFSTSSLL